MSEKLNKAYLAFKRSRGRLAADALIAKHGGDGGIDSVPAAQRDALRAAFKRGLPAHVTTLKMAMQEQALNGQPEDDSPAAQTQRAARERVARDAASIEAGALDPVAIYAKWNSAKRRAE